MNLGRTVFSQRVNFFPAYRESLRDIEACLRAQQPKLHHNRYQGNRHVKEFSWWDQSLCLAFAQLTWASGAKFLAIPWRKPTSIAIDASMPISLRS